MESSESQKNRHGKITRKTCTNFNMHSKNDSRAIGFLIVLIGIAFLLKTIPQTSGLLPRWLFTWPVILILVGALIGVKHRFQRMGWLVLILIGLFFLIREELVLPEYLAKLALPLGIIIIGIFMLFKQKNKRISYMRYNKTVPPFSGTVIEEDTESYINLNSSFGNIEKIVLTKNLKGGNIICSFGGAQIDFTQSDIKEQAVLSFSVTAGGAEISVPSNWNIQNDINVILGGVEDKRKRFNYTKEDERVLILTGNVTLGGLVIKN